MKKHQVSGKTASGKNEHHQEQVALFSYLTLCLVWDSS
jgi:hypothetical protein